MAGFGKTALAIKALFDENSSVKGKEIAEKLGISRQSVYAHARNLGIALAKDRPGRASKNRVWAGHFGNEKSLSSHFIGGASEMIVCADLLRRGIPVYRAVTFVSAADLIADFDGKLVRVEVKSVKRNQAGNINYSAPKPERFDLLALVDRGGTVEYRPTLE